MSLFADRFRALKEENGLTLKELSEDIEISVPNLSYYMKGREPNYDTLISIAEYFGVTTDWLLGISDARDFIQDSLLHELQNIENDFGEYNEETDTYEYPNGVLDGTDRKNYLLCQNQLYNSLIEIYSLFKDFRDNASKKNDASQKLNMIIANFYHLFCYINAIKAYSYDSLSDCPIFTKEKLLEFIRYGELVADLEKQLITSLIFQIGKDICNDSLVLADTDKQIINEILNYESTKHGKMNSLDNLSKIDHELMDERLSTLKIMYSYLTDEMIKVQFLEQ